MEEMLWKQKSRIQGLKEGDRNTKIFHKIASCRQRSNGIHRLIVEGRWVEREDQLR